MNNHKIQKSLVALMSFVFLFGLPISVFGMDRDKKVVRSKSSVTLQRPCLGAIGFSLMGTPVVPRFVMKDVSGLSPSVPSNLPDIKTSSVDVTPVKSFESDKGKMCVGERSCVKKIVLKKPQVTVETVRSISDENCASVGAKQRFCVKSIVELAARKKDDARKIVFKRVVSIPVVRSGILLFKEKRASLSGMSDIYFGSSGDNEYFLLNEMENEKIEALVCKKASECFEEIGNYYEQAVKQVFDGERHNLVVAYVEHSLNYVEACCLCLRNRKRSSVALFMADKMRNSLKEALKALVVHGDEKSIDL